MVYLDGALYIASVTHVARYDVAKKKLEPEWLGKRGETGCMAGDGAAARLRNALSLASDGATLYVGDAACHTVWAVDPNNARARVLLGAPERPTFRAGAGAAAGINHPGFLAVDPKSGDLFISDGADNIIARARRAAAGAASDAGPP
jgi:hypothetical protein